ncbi:RNA polymerase sigma factor [Polyangium jinanense]|uniref:RNA polymerase sigma factor n=1 Tax=Polyangium jinanense TaxID=2829994 RepID=A0A9X3X980_9BACT|nr:RNA polymerase sigma factor [Polyangium jinanense]MDC3962525.1 RNA polymerase sigma factor [Polyangium jinanense]MDC3986057.1 RNA polymerase sigma factor [Polyangium jinanense]
MRLDVRRIVRSDKARTRDSADDKEQQVIANALGDLPNYAPHPDGMKPWVVAIARNVMGTARRITRRHQQVFESDAGRVAKFATSEPSPERAAQLKQALHKVMDAVGDLPPSQAAVLWMVCVQGHSHDEAGAKLGISEDAAKMALSRARDTLRERLGDELFSVPPPLLVLFDWFQRLGHLWALFMAIMFASLALSPRGPDDVAAGAARAVAASATDVAHAAADAAEPASSFEHAGSPVPVMEPPTPKKQTHTPHTPRRPLVDSDKQGRPTSGLSADPKGSSADTSH